MANDFVQHGDQNPIFGIQNLGSLAADIGLEATEITKELVPEFIASVKDFSGHKFAEAQGKDEVRLTVRGTVINRSLFEDQGNTTTVESKFFRAQNRRIVGRNDQFEEGEVTLVHNFKITS